MIRILGPLTFVALVATSVGAQTPAHDPSTRLREVLPADVAERVLAKIADARSRDLPAAALENRAFKLAALGAKPAEIEQSLADHSQRMERANGALQQARGRRPSGEEIDAGAEAIRMGVDGAAVSELARSAPSGRSLAVPLLVIGGLVNGGLSAAEALERVQTRLEERATDADLQEIRIENGGKPALTGRDLAATRRSDADGRPFDTPPAGVPPVNVPPASGPPVNTPPVVAPPLTTPPVAAPPAGVPPNAGSAARPTSGTMPSDSRKPATPPRP